MAPLHVGFAGRFGMALDQSSIRQLADLLLDPRWLWPLRWARYAQDVKPLWPTERISHKRGTAVLVEAMLNPKRTAVRAYFSPRDKENTASLRVNLPGQLPFPRFETSFEVTGAIRVHEPPPAKSPDQWLELANDILCLLKVDSAITTVFRTYDQVWADLTLGRIVIDNRGQPERDLGVTGELARQNHDCAMLRQQLGRTYVRHPRWGNYWLPEHVEKVGGIDRIHEAVRPAKIEQVGHLWYIQLLPTMEDALTPAYAEKRHALEAIMGPIRVPRDTPYVQPK
jgi:hypothetical protein